MSPPAASPRSRIALTIAAALLILAGLAYAFWPRPLEADFGRVTRGAMSMYVEEEARTRVADVYVVSAPASGRISRPLVEVGDRVIAGRTALFRLASAELDPRALTQARAAVNAAEAGVTAAAATLAAEEAVLAQAVRDEARARALADKGLVSLSVLEKAGEALATAEARTRAARSQRAMAEAERSAARALAQTFRDIGAGADSVVITAPAGGQVLRLLEESETTLPAGAPVMEIGDVDGDLEVIAELLSRDAVAVKAGMPVILDAWGGTAPLAAEVIRIEPSGFTKFSALGVEEQRVNVIIGFRSPPAARAGLGAGYRLAARIKTYEAAGVLTAPSTALVRKGNDWIVFVVRQGRALETPVTVIANNGITAEIQGEVDENDLVVLHPTPEIRSGQRLTARKTGP